MAVVAQLSFSNPADRRPARLCARARMLALLPLLAAVLAPASARADLYQWTDEEGRTVISDRLPVDPGSVSGVKLLARARMAVAPLPAAAAPPAPAADAKQQELEARIAELERQLQE